MALIPGVPMFSTVRSRPDDATDADANIPGEVINDGRQIGGVGGRRNGDGADDVVVGADQLFNQGTGKAYVFYGPLATSSSGCGASDR
jgi:hypothetical protein